MKLKTRTTIRATVVITDIQELDDDDLEMVNSREWRDGQYEAVVASKEFLFMAGAGSMAFDPETFAVSHDIEVVDE